jgi:hypothetical protein
MRRATILGVHSTASSIIDALDRIWLAACDREGRTPRAAAACFASVIDLIVHVQRRPRSKTGFRIAKMARLTGWNASGGWQLEPIEAADEEQ